MSFPLIVRAVRLGARGVDPRLEAAARTLGAGRLDVFLTVTLPLMPPGILPAAVHRASRASLGEFGATITFVSNVPGETQTLPLAIYTRDADAGRRRRRAAGWWRSPSRLAIAMLLASEWLARASSARSAGRLAGD